MLSCIFNKIYKPKTPSQRFKKSIFLLKFKNLKKFFKIFIKNSSGRNNLGRITVYSKGLKKKAFTTPNLHPIIWDKNLSTVISIFRNKKKLYTINKHLTGSFSIKPYIQGVGLGQKVFTSSLPKNYWLNNLPGNLVFLKFLNKFTLFSNVFIKNVKKYSLSNGTYCQLLDFFQDYNLCRVTLPSKKIKIISGWNFVFLGKNSQPDFKYKRLCKAGINFFLGKKPKVRGVARNPVDHPHGGRTKTNQPEVSIWGWVAKRNK